MSLYIMVRKSRIFLEMWYVCVKRESVVCQWYSMAEAVW